MARKPRIHQVGGVYHVMLRGNGGQDIFSCDEDRYHLYLLIQEGVSRFGHHIQKKGVRLCLFAYLKLADIIRYGS